MEERGSKVEPGAVSAAHDTVHLPLHCLRLTYKTRHGPACCVGACNLQGQQTDSSLAAQRQQGRSFQQTTARPRMLQGRWQQDEEEAAAEEAASQSTCTQMNSHPGEALTHSVPGRTLAPDENWRKQAAQVYAVEVS